MQQLNCASASGDEERWMKSNWALTLVWLGHRIAWVFPNASSPAGGRAHFAKPHWWQGDKLQFLTIIDCRVFLHFL